MKQIAIGTLEHFLLRLFQACGLTEQNANAVTEIFMRATYRGVMHHDIHMIESRVEALLNNKYIPNPEYKKIHGFQAMEAWDAGNGLGELVCDFGMKRAMELADQFGIGLCALRNRANRVHGGIEKLSPGVHIPGQGNYNMKQKILERGYFEIEDGVYQKLETYGKQFHIPIRS